MRILSSAEHCAQLNSRRIEERKVETVSNLRSDLEAGPSEGWPDRQTDVVGTDERANRMAYLTSAEEEMRECVAKEAALQAKLRALAALKA